MYQLRITRFLYIHLIFGVCFTLLFVIGTEWILHLLNQNHVERYQRAVIDKANAVKAQIEGEFNSTLFLSAGLMAHVATHPNIANEEFSQIASEIVSRGNNIRNIGLAKNNVITHIYPLAGNEAAMGLAYKKLSGQWAAVKKAIELNGTVVAGPVNLVQGGKGLIVRTPIYTRSTISGDESLPKPVYWGLASIVINVDGFFKTAQFLPQKNGIEFAIRGKDGLGAKGEVFMGDPQLFTKDAVTIDISLPNGSWQLAALPKYGWQNDSIYFHLIRIFGWLMAAILGILITALSISRQHNQDLAFYDPLTSLPNRRLLQDRMLQVLAYSKRYRASFGIFYIDLDDFKLTNDRYGHKIGDGLLVEAANRMLASVRATDTVARVGGDEFIILVNDIHHDGDMKNIREQLEKRLTGPAGIHGKSISIQASIGYAIFPDDEDSLEALQNTADKRMYEDKKNRKKTA